MAQSDRFRDAYMVGKICAAHTPSHRLSQRNRGSERCACVCVEGEWEVVIVGVIVPKVTEKLTSPA